MQLNLDGKRLDLIFLVTLLFTLSQPVLFPSLRCMFFAPFLVIALYKRSLIKCLWMAFACGLLLDLLSSHIRLGTYALSFCITVFILYSQRRNFFADSLTTLPIMTILFSCLSTFLAASIIYSVDNRNVFSWPWALTDLIFMPVMDAIYAFCFFILPAFIVSKPRRRGKDYFTR